MNEIIKKTCKEILRVVLSALLAGLGISASGCLAYGSGSTCGAIVERSGN